MLMNNHDYLKRLLSVGLVCLTVLMVLVGCEKGQLSSALVIDAKTGKQIYTLQLDIWYDPNAVLSVYDADIRVDEEYIGTVEQGFRFTESLKLDEGAHWLQFNKHGAPSVCGKTMVKMKEDVILTCSLKGYLSEMEVADKKITPLHPEPATAAESVTEAVTLPLEETQESTALEKEAIASDESSQSPERRYILNTNTHRFHNPDCQSVKKMKDKNKQEFYGTREAAMDEGYQPCSQCNP